MPLLPNLALKIGGDDASADLLNLISEVEIVARQGHPATFTLRLEKGSARDLLRSVDEIVGRTLAPGTKIEISRAAGRTVTQILTGTVDSLGVDLDSSGAAGPPAIVVRGHDRAHALTREERVETFLDVAPSDVAAQIATRYSLRSKIDASPKAAYLIQAGQTDWDYLQVLAERPGYNVYVAGDALHFEAFGKRGHSKLTWGRGLVQFQPVLNHSRQTVQVTVRGWDPDTKQAVEGEGSAGSAGGQGLVKQVGDRVARTVEEAEDLAESIANSVERSGRSGTGLVRPGRPKLMPGVIAQIQGVGTTFGGDYFVATTTHAIGENGYTTSFRVGEAVEGRSPRAVTPEDSRPSVVVGIVTNNVDPYDLARVRVRFPWLGGHEESSWARLAVPMAGQERGTYFLPEVDDEVLLSFEHGDFRAPYVVGALWNGEDRPPEKNENGQNDLRLIRSRSGHEIRFEDTDGGEKVEILSAGGQSILLDDEDERIEISRGSRDHSLVIDSAANGITIKSAGNLELEAAGDLTLKAGGKLAADASGSLSMRASGDAELESAGVLTIRGSVVQIN